MLSRLDVSKFAVLIPIHEKNWYFYSAVNSVLRDVPTACPVYIIIHQPNENLCRFIDNFPERQKIKLLYSTSNTLAGCLNDALMKIPEEWVFRMDSDDLWMPGRFQIQINYLIDNPNVTLISSGIKVHNKLHKKSYVVSTNSPKILNSFDLLEGCPIAHPKVLYNRKSILQIGGYNIGLKAAEDYDLWARLIQNHNLLVTLLKQIWLASGPQPT